MPVWQALLIDPISKQVTQSAVHFRSVQHTALFLQQSHTESFRRFADRMPVWPPPGWDEFWQMLMDQNQMMRLYPMAAQIMGRESVAIESCGDTAVLIVADDVNVRGSVDGFRLTAYDCTMRNRVGRALLILPDQPNTLPVINRCVWKKVAPDSEGGWSVSLVTPSDGPPKVVVTDLSHSCSFCEVREERMRKCGRCKTARYCSEECQTSHWPSHQTQCTPQQL